MTRNPRRSRTGSRHLALGGLERLGLGLLVGLLLAACASSATPASPPGQGSASVTPSTASPLPAASLPASPVDGVIIAVDASSLSDVRGFTLLTPAGQRIAFTLGVLQNPTEFPPGHLAEHQATSAPVRVYFQLQNGVPVVYRLADAPTGSPAAS